MTERLIIAYGLIALLVVAGAVTLWWNIYYSGRRSYHRQLALRKKRASPDDLRKDHPNDR